MMDQAERAVGSIDVTDPVTIARLVRQTGKHALPQDVVDALVRTRRPGEDRGDYFSVLRDCVLDKVDGTYHYRTYLGLPLFEHYRASTADAVDDHTLSRLLVADVVRFELAGRDGRCTAMPRLRPSGSVVDKRIRHALRHIHGVRFTRQLPRSASLAGVALRPRLRRLLPRPVGPDLQTLLATSVLPVDTFHDEYLFLRVLQSYELTFRSIESLVRRAVVRTRDGEYGAAADALVRAADEIKASTPLFSMLATMDLEAFRRFRELTEGASAIQSQHYKRFELRCGRPRSHRADSEAFLNVPTVRADIDDTDSLTDAVLDQLARRSLRGRDRNMVLGAMTQLEESHQRWKTTHLMLASRALGNASGSGYTAGVPYLKSVLDNRLFWRLGDLLDVHGDGPVVHAGTDAS